MLSIFGTIGRNAELRYTQSGTAVCGVAVAYNYGMKDPNTGYKPSQWVECTLWGKQAEGLAQYLLKGQQIHVVLRDVHVETFAKNDGTQGVKLVGDVVTIDFARGQQQQTNQPAPAPIQQPAQPPHGYPQGYQFPQSQQQNQLPDDPSIPF